MNGFSPVGSSLPPRRDVVSAGDQMTMTAAEASRGRSPWPNPSSINVPRARDRMLEYFERDQVPGDVRSTLAAGLNGDLHYQSLLFIAMMDTWPKLQKNINEIARLVSIAPWKVVAASKRGKKPDPAAEDLAEWVEDLIWGMKPKAERRENGLEGTIEQHAFGYYFGHSVSQIRWERAGDGTWKPRATKPLPARYFGYPYDAASEEDPEDRLMLDREGSMGARQFEDFPANQFLIGVNCGHPGHPAVAAPLRALAAYWLATIFGLRWLMDFTQIYGIPWRHAKVANGSDVNVVANALDKIGQRGHIITEPGVEIDILEAPSISSALPQKELIDLADKQCDTFILGQTLSSGTEKNGNRNLGEVHADTKQDMVDAVADHVGRILTYQLAPAIVEVNYGPGREDIPGIWARREESKDETAEAERMAIIIKMGFPMEETFVYETLGVPQPAADAKLFQPVANGAQGDPAPGAGLPHETKTGLETPLEKKDKLAAADATDEAVSTIDALANAVAEEVSGVARQWLSPVKPIFARLAAVALSKTVTDEDWQLALEKAYREMPELFEKLDSQSLQDAFEKAISSGLLAGSVSRYEK